MVKHFFRLECTQDLRLCHVLGWDGVGQRRDGDAGGPSPQEERSHAHPRAISRPRRKGWKNIVYKNEKISFKKKHNFMIVFIILQKGILYLFTITIKVIYNFRFLWSTRTPVRRRGWWGAGAPSCGLRASTSSASFSTKSVLLPEN